MDLNWLEARFHECQHLSEDERQQRLQTWQTSHPQEVAHLSNMLAVKERANRFDQPLRLDFVQQPPSVNDHEIITRLGQGGMGTVYLAQQLKPIRRRVALKMLHINLPVHIDKFIEERQTLTRLQHPHIAQVLQAGIDAHGRPWFTMPLLEGLPLCDFCDQHQLGLSQRLELFRQVCEAIHHAHQRRIIHRDIKNSNILAIKVDGKAQVQVIDFGIATSLFSEQSKKASPFLGSLPYISPEQLDQKQDVDTRSDIFSLGVLLHQLLLDQPPFPIDDEITPQSYRRTLTEHKMQPVTQRLRSQLASAAARMNMTGSQLRRAISGDMEAIIAKCLAIEPEARYPSVDALSKDLERFKAVRPVSVRKPKPWQRPLYFMRRSPGKALLILALSLLLLFALFQKWHQLELENQRLQVEQEKLEVSAAYDAYQEMYYETLRMFSSWNLGSEASEIRQRLRQHEERLMSLPTRDPETFMNRQFMIGSLYKEIGDYQKALQHFEAVLEYITANEHQAPTLWKKVHTIDGIARSQYELGRLNEAYQSFLLMRKQARALQSIDNLFTIRAELGLAMIQLDRGNGEIAQDRFEEWLPKLNQHQYVDELERQSYVIQQAIALRQIGQAHLAESRLRGTIAALKSFTYKQNPVLLSAQSNLASTLIDQGKQAEAYQLQLQVYSMRVDLLGARHPKTLQTMDSLTQIVIDRGCHTEADYWLKKLFNIDPLLEQLPPANQLAIFNRYLISQRNLGDLSLLQRVQMQLLVIEFARDTELWEAPAYLTALNNLADDLIKLKQAAKALPFIEEAVAVHRYKNPPKQISRLHAEITLGEVHQALKNWQSARTIYQQLVPQLEDRPNLANHVKRALAQIP